MITGNVLEKEVLTKALEGKDAVLSALGSGKSLKLSNLVSKASNTFIPAMNDTGVKCVIFLSAFGVGNSFKQANFIQKFIFRTFLKYYDDKAKGEDQVRKSSLEWETCLSCFTNQRSRHRYIYSCEQLPMKGMPKILQADVADLCLGN